MISVEPFCKPQGVLSSRCFSYFAANGWEITRDISSADFVLVNTCGFHEKTQDCSREEVRKALAGVRKGVKVGVIGCLNKINPKVLKEFPSAIIMDDLKDLNEFMNAKIPISKIDNFNYDETLFKKYGFQPSGYQIFDKVQFFLGNIISKSARKFSYPFAEASHLQQVLAEMDHGGDRSKIYIEIGKGCVGECSYCVIKKARGPIESRKEEDILAELKKIYKPGKIINLVADDCGSWGIDFKKTIFDLINGIEKALPGAGIDLCYINPFWFEKYPDEYVKMCENANISSINVSLQSGSDKIIVAMNRKYKAKNVLNVIKRIRAVSPRTMLWAHLMIGYPGETLRDFIRTMRAATYFDFYCTFYFSSVRSDQNYSHNIIVWLFKNVTMRSLKYFRMFLKLFFILPSK